MTGQTQYKVLFVEDDKFDQMAFKRLVTQQQLPYNYTIAESLQQAKDILVALQFDVVITDYCLGDGTGFDVITLAGGTPVVFVTGAGDEEIAVQALKHGAYDYMVKDGGCDHLKLLPQVLRQAVIRKQTADELRRYHSNLETLVDQRTDQLAREKELLSITLSGMTDAVIAADAKKQIFLFNPVAEQLTKWKADEAHGQQIDLIVRLIDERTAKPLENRIDKALASGEIEYATDRDLLVARDGECCPVAATIAPIRGSEGAVGVVAVLRNVCREREIDRMKRNLVSCVSHELRTPLTAIRGYIATLLRDPNMPEQTRHKFLTVVDAESNRLQKLIESLLELAHIESGGPMITMRPVCVPAAINQAIETVRLAAQEKNIRLTADIPPDLADFCCDQTGFRSMVTNLLDNAVKFTPSAGCVSISAQRSDCRLTIRVSDTGMGIPANAMPHIFDRFYRVSGRDAQIPGTGLGLAIVKEFVDMHCGHIEVESEPGKGSTFTVYLPLPDAKAESTTPTPPPDDQ